MSKFPPDDFEPTTKNQTWAREKFCIDHDEVERQTEMMVDHEFLRHYTDWQRVFKNWIRKADEIQTLRREHKPRQPEEVTNEMKAEDQRLFDEQIERFKNKGRS